MTNKNYNYKKYEANKYQYKGFWGYVAVGIETISTAIIVGTVLFFYMFVR